MTKMKIVEPARRRDDDKDRLGKFKGPTEVRTLEDSRREIINHTSGNTNVRPDKKEEHVYHPMMHIGP